MRLNTFILSACIGWIACACSEQELSTQQGEITAPIALSASINGSMQAGSRVDDEPVEVSTGDYYLTYTPTNSNSTQTVYTIFSDGTGYPYLSTTGTTRTRLNWGHVKNESGQCTLYLDNVPDENAASTTIELGDSYKAGPYTGENCEGDILWGKYNDSHNENPLSIYLCHRMASVKINIDAEDANVEDQMNQPITVLLSNIKDKADTFDRLTGKVTAASTKAEEEVIIHNKKVLDTNGDTDVFLFPPQTFSTEDRPRLTIVLSDETTYRGTLPEIMHIDDGSSITDPNLELRAGYLLTIRVNLVQSVNEQVIEFLPAVVEDWVEKTIVPIPSKQVGITDNEEYEDVVEAYNKLYAPDTTEEEKAACRETLERYATYDEEKEIWTIRFFANLTCDDGTTITKFSNGEHLTLDFRGHTIYGQNSEEGLIATETPEEEAQL